ncbi:MAG TPA: reverse transcriptase domain-containing protein [Dehalococcoidia bacterium]|nr:reverse transcriptase domain-containing protein [Dehalococcoidia bacterium]
MRNAETILGIIRERGKQGLPLENIYRLLYNRDLYLRAYARLYRNEGAMTRGATTETVDGMSLAKIDKLIDDVRRERHRWTPVRRVYIEKKRSKKKRPLGLPTWSDKLLQEVLRSLLEAYYEPQFSDHSHGFRPNRGCHTALREVERQWTGTRWFVEGDIAQYFDSIDHEVLLATLSEKIHDSRFLRLIRHLLQAGYVEQWVYGKTLSGTPQGGVISPLLANIYLDKLDTYVEQVLIPAYTRGTLRRGNPAYTRNRKQARKARTLGQKDVVRVLQKELRKLPSKDPKDPDYRRLKYVRYADDFLLGFAGPRAEAEAIKAQLAEFLRKTLRLELSEAKTLITHAVTKPARFLGYDIVVQHADDRLSSGRRHTNGKVALRVPVSVVREQCAQYKESGKVTHRPELVNNDDYTIVADYQYKYRGFVQYYMLAQNVSKLWSLTWAMQTSLLKTLADKHGTSVRALYRKYRSTITADSGETLVCLEVRRERGEGKPPLIARFGGIALRHAKAATLDDRLPVPIAGYRSELLTRLLAEECELCGSREHIEVHHIRKLADLKRYGRRERPAWVTRMVARRRKTLVVCRSCHTAIHAGRPTPLRSSEQAT